MCAGDDDDSAESSSKTEEVIYFTPRSLTNLSLIDEMESMSPILDMKVADLVKEQTPQIYTVRTNKCVSVLKSDAIGYLVRWLLSVCVCLCLCCVVVMWSWAA